MFKTEEFFSREICKKISFPKSFKVARRALGLPPDSEQTRMRAIEIISNLEAENNNNKQKFPSVLVCTSNWSHAFKRCYLLKAKKKQEDKASGNSNQLSGYKSFATSRVVQIDATREQVARDQDYHHRDRRKMKSKLKMNHHRHHNQLTRDELPSSSSSSSSSKRKKRRLAGLANMANCSSSKFIFLLFVFILSMVMSEYGNCAKLPDIYWNSSNPIFRIDNTDHIFDVNKKQHDHDQVDIVCPQPLEGKANATTATADQERYIIYSVSKEEYDTCRLNGRGRVVAVCDSAGPESQPAKMGPPVTITFRSFTPQPNGLEFAAGQDYYFISALFGHHHDPQRRFSPCREHNMKVIFKVCCKSSAPPAPAPLAAAVTSGPGRLSTPPALTRSAPSGSTLGRRPQQQAASVITLRPALPKLAEPNAINSYFDPLPGSPFGSTTIGQSQPITVLPIEVLSQPNSGSHEPAGQQQPSNDLSSSSKDDILAEQPQTPTTLSPPPPPPPPASYPNMNPIRRLPPNAPHHPFIRFTPSSDSPPVGADSSLRNFDRWAPTPLPGELHRKHLRFPPQATSQQQQQQQWLDQSGWPAQYHRNGLAGNGHAAAGWGQPAASRGSFYWSTFKPSYEPPMKDLISIQEEQQSSGSSRLSSSSPSSNFLLPASILLLAVGWLFLLPAESLARTTATSKLAGRTSQN